MEDIRKIKLKDEQQVENNGGAVKNPKRLPPTGSGTDSGLEKEFSDTTSAVISGELTKGNYHWNITGSASVKAQAFYKRENITDQYELDYIKYTCLGASITLTGGTDSSQVTGTGSHQNGTAYESVSSYGNINSFAEQICSEGSSARFDIAIAQLKGFRHEFRNGVEQLPNQLDTMTAEAKIVAGCSVNPYFGISALGVSLEIT